MKAILEFDLPEDQESLERHLKSLDMFSVLVSLDEMLRSKLKHGNLSNEVYDELEKLREWLLGEINDRQIPMF